MKPKILLSTGSSPENYIEAVIGCGGIPTAQYLPEPDTSYDGLILCGGGDIDPSYFGEEVNGSRNIDQARDQAEFALVKAYIEMGKPVLGICRGHQILNVYFGGSLHQDLSNAACHSSFADYDLIHPVAAERHSLLASLFGAEFVVNSSHHQAVKALGEGLKVTLRSGKDGTVEGIEHNFLPVFGVQWHPERMCFQKKREDTADGSAIFRYFIELCSHYKKADSFSSLP